MSVRTHDDILQGGPVAKPEVISVACGWLPSEKRATMKQSRFAETASDMNFMPTSVYGTIMFARLYKLDGTA